jgi:hypothetical protein
MVEALTITLVGALLLWSFQSFFSGGVKSTLKGQDNLETIRSASQLFMEMRKDLLACQSVTVAGTASFTMGVGDTAVPAFPADATFIAFESRNATVTYELTTRADGKKFILKTTDSGGVIKNQEFGVPRMVSFKAIHIAKWQQLFPAARYLEKQVLVEVELDSKDKRFPTKNLKLTTFFISSQMSSSNWNYFL